MSLKKERKKNQDLTDGSITFSLRAHAGDVIAKRYQTAKFLGIAVTSPFRHDLSLFDSLLSLEEKNLVSSERKIFSDLIRTIALSSMIRTEDPPDRQEIIRYLRMANKNALISFVANSTNVRLFLIVDRAREFACQMEIARTERVEGVTGNANHFDTSDAATDDAISADATDPRVDSADAISEQ